jgi:hypothetical protein
MRWSFSEIELLKRKYVDMVEKVQHGEEKEENKKRLAKRFIELDYRKLPTYNVELFFEMLYAVCQEENK